MQCAAVRHIHFFWHHVMHQNVRVNLLLEGLVVVALLTAAVVPQPHIGDVQHWAVCMETEVIGVEIHSLLCGRVGASA